MEGVYWIVISMYTTAFAMFIGVFYYEIKYKIAKLLEKIGLVRIKAEWIE